MSRRRTAALVLSTAALAGCGLEPPGAAAVVGGDLVTVAEVQQASQDLSQLVGQQVPPADALGVLVSAPFVLEEAEARGGGVSEEEARRQMEVVAEPSDAGVLAVRSLIARSYLGQALPPEEAQAASQAVTQALEDADVEINPRYGRLEGLGVVPEQPPWLVVDGEVAAPTS